MRSYTFTITPKELTQRAQDIHNDIDENGDFSCEAIIDELTEELGESLRTWVEDNIDWCELASNDMEARNDYNELREARRLAIA